VAASDNLNTAQFVSRVKSTGGATANLSTGKLVNPGTKGYMVGGERDTKGAQIPSTIVPSSEFGEQHVAEAANKIRGATGNRARTHLGAWEDSGKVYLDAASVTKRPGEAIRKGRARNEISIWDNKRMKEIKTGGTGESK